MGLFSRKSKSNQINNQPLKVGDWVNSYSKGIFQIQQIIIEYYDESSPLIEKNLIGQKQEYRTIVSKQLLNSQFKKSISYESCSEYYVSSINSSQRGKLNKILKKNPNLITDLQQYKTPDILSVYNMPLQIDNDKDLTKIKDLILFIQNGKTFLEIRQEFETQDLLRLKPKNFGNYKFKLININNEYSDNKKVWRQAKLEKEE